MKVTLKNISDWTLRSLLEIDENQSRREFIKKEFFLEKRSPALCPDPRSKDIKELEGVDWLTSRGWDVLAIRWIGHAGPFKDVFEAYVAKTVCPECGGETVQFKGMGMSSQYRVCSKWKEPGHLDEAGVKKALADFRRSVCPSGRWA